jgi:hypothetical protein
VSVAAGDLRRQIGERHDIARAANTEALGDVLQLAHVAGPVVVGEHAQRIGTELERL